MRLFIMRHGEAEPLAVSDMARNLTERGRRQAEAAAEWLREEQVCPELFLVSPFTRTRQTAGIVAEVLNIPPEQITLSENVLHGSDPHAFLRTLPEDPETGETRTVLMVSHMPFVSLLCGLLVHGNMQQGEPFYTAQVEQLQVHAALPGGAESLGCFVPHL